MDSPEMDPVEDVEVEKLLKLLDQAIHDSRRSRRSVERSLGLGQGYLRSLFNGRIELKVWHIYRLSRVLEIDPMKLFFQVSLPQDRRWVLEQLGLDPDRVLEMKREAPLSLPSSPPAPEEEGPVTKAQVNDLIRDAIRDELDRRGLGS
jgi:hypothetical protein